MGFKWMVYIAVTLLWSGCKGKKDNTYQDIVRPVSGKCRVFGSYQ